MQNLNRLWQAAQTIADLRDLTRHRRTFTFMTQGPITVYLRSEQADVRVMRWALPRVEVTATLEGAFGWRMGTDQDEAGVYIAARRRAMVGALSHALFEIVAPEDAWLLLKLDDGRVTLEGVQGALQIPPRRAAMALTAGEDQPTLAGGR